MGDPYERKDVIKQPEILELESDRDLILRFSKDLYTNISHIIGIVECDKILDQTNCKKCGLYIDDQCDMVRIKNAAHRIMWAVKPENPKDYPKYK